jgi:prophage tail gpP-like protein
MRISLGLDQMSGAFELSVSGENARELSKHPLRKGLECKVLLNDQVVITGYINKRRPAYDKNSHTLSISGRDVTCDLVDCSAIVVNQELHNVTIADAARQLTSPFPAIRLDCPAPGAPFAKFVVNDGDTIFSVLESHAKQRGLMIYTTGDGVLRIRKPAVNSTGLTLTETVNILSASAEDSDDEQFAEYIVRGQDSDKGKHQAEQRYTDSRVRKGRVRIITAEKPDDGAQIKNRAEWEAKLRQAKSVTATVAVQGWESKPGTLWRLGDSLKLHSPMLEMDHRAVVVNNITYAVDDNSGTTTELALVLPEVYVYG